MSFILRGLGGLLLLIFALAALGAKTDRIFNNLTPTEGQAWLTPLQAGHTYRQVFTTPRLTLTKLGLYITPLRQSLPAVNVKVSLWRGKSQIGQTAVSLTTIPPDGPTYAVFEPPIITQRGETLSLTLEVPAEASGTVAVSRRQVDATFPAADIPFSIDQVTQSEPMALAAYALYRPAFMVAIGVGLLLAALLLWTYPVWFPWRWGVYGVGILAISLVPWFLVPAVPWLLPLTTLLAATGMFFLLKRLGLPPVASIAGANLFAFTTWFPLQALATRDYLLLVAALPYLFLSRYNRRYLGIVFVWVVIIFAFGHQINTVIPANATASLRDIFVDPYQVSIAEKTNLTSVTWDHFGSYIGLINLVLFVIGIIWRGKRVWRWLLGGLICLLIATWPPLVQLLSHLPVAPQYFIIGTTFVIAYVTSWGVTGLLTYLRPGRLEAALTAGVVLLALLDLYYVWSAVIEFTSL